MTWQPCDACAAGQHSHELVDHYCDCPCGCTARTPDDELAAEQRDDRTRYEQSLLDRALDKIEDAL